MGSVFEGGGVRLALGAVGGRLPRAGRRPERGPPPSRYATWTGRLTSETLASFGGRGRGDSFHLMGPLCILTKILDEKHFGDFTGLDLFPASLCWGPWEASRPAGTDLPVSLLAKQPA